MRPPYGTPSNWLSPKEAALEMGVHDHTIKRIPPSELPYFRVGVRGDRKYARADVLAYIERRMVR